MSTEVGSAYFTLLPTVRGLQGAIAREVSGVNGTAAGASVGNQMGNGIVGRLKAVVGPAIAAFGVAKAWGFAKDAVASFSELEDSSAAAQVIFSGNMGKITALSKTASSSLGLSSQQVVNSSAMFGTYGKAAGLAGTDLEDFALRNTKLAGDLASFKGTSPEDAITAIGAAFRGEMEPIRQYGVLLDDASLRQEALKMGLISTTKDALSPQQKTLAAQSLIMKQTTDAQGDFLRTQQSTANVAKTLAADTENLSAKVGSLLAPAFTAVRLKAIDAVGGVSGFLDKVVAVQGVLGAGGSKFEIAEALGFKGDQAVKVAGFLQTIQTTVEKTFGGIGSALQSSGVGSFFQTLQFSFAPLVPLVTQLWQSFSPLSVLFQSLAPVLPVLFGAFGAFASSIATTLVGALTAVLPVLTQLSGILIDSLGTVFTALAPVIVSMLGQLSSYFTQLAPVIVQIVTVVAQLAGELVAALLPILTELITAVFPVVVSIFGSVLQAIIPVVQQVAGFLIPVIQALLPVVVFVFQAVAAVVTSVMQIVQGIIQVVTGLISGNWSQVWQGMGNILAGVWNTIVAVVRGALGLVGSVVVAGVSLAVNFAQSAFSGLVGFLGGVWSNIVNGVSGMIGNVLGFFAGLGGRILGALGNVAGVLFSAGQNIVQGLINGIGSMMGAIGRAVLSIVPEAIRGPFEALLGIHSPSEVTTWWGEMLGLGLVVGIQGSTRKVAGAVGNLARAATPNAQALALAGSRTTYRPPAGELGTLGENLEIHVHGDMFGDAREVAVELIREKKRAVQVHNIDAVAAGV